MARSSTTFKKGEAKGKPKGVLNKTTRDIKEAYQQLIEKNLDNLTSWLEQIAEKDPEKAIKIIAELSEYVIPKLARKEFTGKGGSELFPPAIAFKDFKDEKP
jgi:vacuolar-type H+-ATPase subunit E/Vma4